MTFNQTSKLTLLLANVQMFFKLHYSVVDREVEQLEASIESTQSDEEMGGHHDDIDTHCDMDNHFELDTYNNDILSHEDERELSQSIERTMCDDKNTMCDDKNTNCDDIDTNCDDIDTNCDDMDTNCEKIDLHHGDIQTRHSGLQNQSTKEDRETVDPDNLNTECKTETQSKLNSLYNRDSGLPEQEAESVKNSTGRIQQFVSFLQIVGNL